MERQDGAKTNSGDLRTGQRTKISFLVVLVITSFGLAQSSAGSKLISDVCTGSPISQTPANVTAGLSNVARGITVTQITSSSFNWNTYADILAYSPSAGVLVFNFGNNRATVASANLDGSRAQMISGNHQATQVHITVDGRFAYYQGQNPNGSADIYAVPLTESGNCRQQRLSNLNMRFRPPVGALVISTSSIERASHHNVIAFSEGPILHRVLDNGTALPDLNLPDPENAEVFHRMRLNPVFSNILYYKRDRPLPNPIGVAQPEIWVVNLNSPKTAYSVTGSVPADHASWSNDGTKLGYIYNGSWWVANVLRSDGSFDLNSNGSFTLSRVGPPPWSGFSVNFCTLSPDASVYVCSQSNKAIYLMSRDGARTKFLASPDSNPRGAILNGVPKPRFLDMQHIIFSSDRTGTPEVYVITGFTTSFP